MFEFSPVRLLFIFICRVGFGQGHFPVPFPSHLLGTMGLDVFSYSSMVAILVLSVVGSSCGSDPDLGLRQPGADLFWPLCRPGFPCFAMVVYHVIDSSGQDLLV